MVVVRDISFYPILARIMDSFSCSPHNNSFDIGKKHEKDFQKYHEYAEMRHGDIILVLH